MTDAQQTDTPLNLVRSPPVPETEIWKAFIGDLARPIVLIAGGIGSAIAVVIVATKVESTDAAAFTFAVGAGLAALYGAKAFENANIAKHTAQAQAKVDVAKVSASGPASAPDPATGELPASERIG